MSEYYCKEHQILYFKKGKMKGYAHPIGNTGEWCNMPEDQEPMAIPTQDMTHKVEPEGMPPPFEELPGQHLPPPNPQELGMWYKEVGNRIGDGSMERDFPKSHVSNKSQYYKRMSEVTGIDFKKKEE